LGKFRLPDRSDPDQIRIPQREISGNGSHAVGQGTYKALYKVPCELHVFPYGGHGFGGCRPQPAPPIPGMMPPDLSAVTQWKESFVNWLNRTLGQ